MTSLAITLLIFLSHYFFLSSVLSETALRRILLSFLLTCSQIIMTQLILGLLHNLYASYLLIANLSIVTLLLLVACRSGKCTFLPTLKTDYGRIRLSLAAALDVYTVPLGILVIMTYSWILVASYYLPPRGIDDLTYHLPVIFEYIQAHEIKLLPVELRDHFAFPENAEFLFMWPTIFAKNQRMIDSLNIPFVLFSILTVYALLRLFDISGRDSFFAAMLYALCPVVVMQAGVNYIDIIVSLFFLLSLYFSILFYFERRIRYLFAAGTSIGLILGMKYTALLLVLPLQFLVVPGLFRVKRRYLAGYVALIAVLSGWWYLRNSLVLSNPFYPLNLLGFLFGKHGEGSLLNNITINIPHLLSRYLINDTGIGTYDGGFGLVFWGIGFSSWLYLTIYSLLHPRETGLARFIILAYLPVGFLLLLMNPESEVLYVGRFSMFVVAIGLFAFCETMKILDDKLCISIMKITCTVLCLVTLSLMMVSNKPNYIISTPIFDRINQGHLSEYKYYSESISIQQSLRYIWEPLDFITRDDNSGLICSLISDYSLLSPAPLYGSKLQNHVIYSSYQPNQAIDAYVYTYRPNNDNERDMYDINGKYNSNRTLNELTNSAGILADDNYMIVSHSRSGCLLLHKNIYRTPGKQRLLRTYYQSTWPEAIIVAKQMEPVLEENIPIITSSQIGYGLRYIDMLARRNERVLIVPENMEGKLASMKKIERCYTLHSPLPGYSYTKMRRAVYKNSEVDIYLNRKP